MSTDEAGRVSKIRSDLRQLATRVVDAYEMRVCAISGMVKQAYDIVNSYQQDVEHALSILRDNMAKGRSLRHRDFDGIIADVVTIRAHREKQVLENLIAFAAEEKAMTARLRQILANGDVGDIVSLGRMQEDILDRAKRRQQKVVSILRTYEVEAHELRAALRWLLDKGDAATVAHLRSVANAMTTRWAAEERCISEVVGQLEAAGSQVRSRWQKVVSASA